MMKRGLIIFLLILAMPLVLSQEIAETVENRLQIEFHAVTGTDSITLDLPKYFGKDADFVYSETVNVDVSIDPQTHVATLRTKDPNWRGTETVVFATSVEWLVEDGKEGPYIIPRNVTLVRINVSKEDIALDTDAFTQQEFDTMLGNLTSEPVSIASILSNSSLTMNINDEVVLNLSFGEAKPRVDMDWKLKQNPNMTAARYQEGSDIIFFSLIIFGLFALVVVLMYLYYSYIEAFKETMFAPKREKVDISKKIMGHKRTAFKELNAIQKRASKERSSKLYRECINVMNKFLGEALGVRGSNMLKINERLKKLELKTGTVNKINIYITERKSRVFTGKSIKSEDIIQFVQFLKSIIERI
jgi:hypothetical protein